MLSTTLIDWEGMGVNPQIIVENCNRVKGRFIPQNDTVTDEPVALVAYGASLRATWRELEKFSTIFTCSGAHKFLVDRGIVPTHHVESDPRAHKIAMLGEPQPGVEYLIASVCNSNYFDALEKADARILLWHILFNEDGVYELYPKGDWVITGGNITGPRMIKIARLHGYLNLHLFGFDGSGKHAGTHTNPVPLDFYNPIVIRGREYAVTNNMLHQTKLMFEDLDRMPEVKTTWYGDGMNQDMARNRTPKKLERWPLAVQR